MRETWKDATGSSGKAAQESVLSCVVLAVTNPALDFFLYYLLYISQLECGRIFCMDVMKLGF